MHLKCIIWVHLTYKFLVTALAHIIHILHSFGTGGMERIVASVIEGTLSPLLRHSVVCMTDCGDSSRFLPGDVTLTALHKPPGNSFHFIRRLSRHLAGMHPDVVHTYNWSGTDGIIAARLAGINTIIHSEHGWDMDDPHGSSRKRIYIRRFLSRFTIGITCVSKQMEGWLTSAVKVRCPVHHIYNGVDTEQFRPDGRSSIRQELAIPAQAFVCGIVSRLDPIKDHPLLLRVFSRFLQRCPDAYLLIVGDGPERDRLRKIAGPHVCFLGNRHDISYILRGLDLFVLTSLNEGISCAITEAMASGLPVVASAVGGNTELVEPGRTGLLFPAGDGGELLECLLRCHADRAMLRRFGRAGRRKMVAEFSNEQMIRAYQSLYQRALNLSEPA